MYKPIAYILINTSDDLLNVGTRKLAAIRMLNMTVVTVYHWGLCVVLAGDFVLVDNFREDAILSRGFFPFAGDLRDESDKEDLDLPTCNRVRLSELGGLEDSFISDLVSPLRTSDDAASPGRAFSAAISLFCLHVLSEAFLTSMVLFPKSADRRLSRCRRALLKKEKPFSSDLLLRCRSLVETLGERRLVTEELLLELLTDFLSTRALSPLLEGEERATELPRRLLTIGLVCIESRL